jgi:hypothetical protein
MARKVKEVQRKIFFYRLRVQPDSNGNTPSFHLRQILLRINALNFDETQGRYLTAPDDNVYCCWVDKSDVKNCANRLLKPGFVSSSAAIRSL